MAGNSLIITTFVTEIQSINYNSNKMISIIQLHQSKASRMVNEAFVQLSTAQMP